MTADFIGKITFFLLIVKDAGLIQVLVVLAHIRPPVRLKFGSATDWEFVEFSHPAQQVYQNQHQNDKEPKKVQLVHTHS